MSRSSNVPKEYGLEQFLTFTAEDHLSTASENSSLADFINDWLRDPRGPLGCFGSFEIFLKVIPLIVDAWYQDPTILDYGGSVEENRPPFQRRVTSAFGDDEDLHPIFDRDNFTVAMFNWQHLRRRR